ncbi:hypothetical protein OnM2_031029 [Erysiphe neolycopersici]|uniref:DNA recombination and repair protein Rad51-like C-terminal domain-containing protein n=1 Tax=Erysiphe neolycopersici TaxID=212602 RepID=A0A420HZ13_9PEZI|nr:hypothetical protein OnM2_031029 [Erysiphe neolycopersici]
MIAVKSYKELKPIQGNYLLSLEETYAKKNLRDKTERIVNSGCLAIDDLLGGGLERGNVIGLSCEGIEGRIFSFNLLSSILITQLEVTKPTSAPQPLTKAIIIDSTGSFPLTLLVTILKSRIIANHHHNSSNHCDHGTHRDDESFANVVDHQIQRCLEMVNISRIFDLEGLWEVLGETDNVKHMLSTRNSSASPNVSGNIGQVLSVKPTQSALSPSIACSSAMEGGIEVLLVDNMTALISEFLTTRENEDAHNKLKLLSQKLHIFTRERNILSLLHNTTVHSNIPPTNPHIFNLQSHNTKSIFPSNSLKPALGQIFAQFTSLHLFFSSLPRARKDANIVYQKTKHPNSNLKLDLASYTIVIEVLKDDSSNSSFVSKGRTIGWREGKWIAVDLNKDMIDFNHAFPLTLKGKREQEKLVI